MVYNLSKIIYNYSSVCKKGQRIMFGYVKINKPELKVKEYEAYRGIYCSLCKAIGRYFGQLARLTLSYDVTFLVLARLSFLNKKPCFKGGRCPFNPAKSCNYCLNADDEFRYAAAVSMMLFYRKVRDNIEDSSFFRRILMYLILPYASLKNRKARKLYPHIEKEIADAMKKQSENEKSRTDSFDKAAHESAHALGMIFKEGMEKDADKCYRFGYGIGKWVYLCDAAEDMVKDMKRGSYNPFVIKYSLKNETDITAGIRDEIEGSLNMSCALACEAYGEIEDKALSSIVENIIYEGTEKVMNNILKGKDCNERSL